MKILICIFFVLLVTFFTSKIKIKIRYLEKDANSFSIKFNINLGLYVFGFVKILGVTLQEDAIHFLFLCIPYSKMKIDRESMKIVKEIPVLDCLELLHLKLDKLNLELKIGSEDMILTVFSVFAISTFLSIVSAQNRKKINLKNYYYKITPIYNTNLLSIELSSQISIKILNIVRLFQFLKKQPNKECQVHVKKVPLKI